MPTLSAPDVDDDDDALLAHNHEFRSTEKDVSI